ncbi:hypothetical protein BDY21DRAFT_341101 [Lineolata rhizophorae]|uniref:Zn(2)-C6 fungal-type domain-containing protein n=1 Tax=Lineolata rhizophorae TaxID=578093 RepID=A0A6A6P3U9_9PEZI|nr:hypothetical protein BDY21DRAFT_341101 [Lineolata rhizophorae]
MDKQRRVAQACDACKLRKVRCNGEEPCQQCNHLDLKCMYTSRNRSRAKRTMERGSVISKYKRHTQRPRVSTSPHPIAPAPPPTSMPSQLEPRSPIFDTNFFIELIPDYLSCVYPVNPVITEAEVRDSIFRMNAEREHAAFAHAYAAVTINLTRSDPIQQMPDISSQISELLSKAIDIQGPVTLDDHPTIRKIMSSTFLEICFMALRKYDLAFYYLREAITMIHMMRIENPEAMQNLDSSERARRQRLYWEAFVHERFLAIADFRPCVLSPLWEMPEFDPSLPYGIHEGFYQIIKLFRLMDDDFLRRWLGDRSLVDVPWVEEKHKQLDDDLKEWEVEVGMLNDMQQADLIITRQWMRTVIWQMAMSNCLLSSTAAKDCMTFQLPLRLSTQLRHFIIKISPKAIGIHGSGILEKLFEITDTIADVVIHVPAATFEETSERVDDFLFLCRFLFAFPRIEALQKQILQKKLDSMRSHFPLHMRDVGPTIASPTPSLYSDTDPSSGFVGSDLIQQDSPRSTPLAHHSPHSPVTGSLI